MSTETIDEKYVDDPTNVPAEAEEFYHDYKGEFGNKAAHQKRAQIARDVSQVLMDSRKAISADVFAGTNTLQYPEDVENQLDRHQSEQQKIREENELRAIRYQEREDQNVKDANKYLNANRAAFEDAALEDARRAGVDTDFGQDK